VNITHQSLHLGHGSLARFRSLKSSPDPARQSL